YIVSKLCLSWTFYFISSNMVEDINSVDDYGGHYFLGPLFVFLREAFAVGFGVYSGVYLAPKHKKTVFTFFIFLWVLFLLLISFAIGLTFFRMEWTTVKLLRNFTFTNNYNSHTANTCSMLIGGFEIYGGEGVHKRKVNGKLYIDFDSSEKNNSSHHFPF
nr:hypothetical protein [Smithellaceae bacterium]